MSRGIRWCPSEAFSYALAKPSIRLSDIGSRDCVPDRQSRIPGQPVTWIYKFLAPSGARQ